MQDEEIVPQDKLSRKIYVTKIKKAKANKYSTREKSEEQRNPETEQFNEYMMIRTKEIDYLDNPCIAIYFQNMTTHVE